MREQTSSVAFSPADLNLQLRTGDPPLVIDTLPGERYRCRHLPGAANACVFEVTFLDQVAAICADRARSVVVYGVNDKTHDAITAAEKLRRAGYAEVAVLEGGLAAWQAAGYPLEGEAPAGEEATSNLPAGGCYPIDVAASVIEWTGRNPNGGHHGTLRLASGEVQIEAGVIHGSFTLDMTSIDNVDLAGQELKPVLEAHLKSDDFFFVERFPGARFELTATPITPPPHLGAANYRVTGTLHLRGIRAAQEFTATILPTTEGGLVAEAHFDFDRTRWGVIYGSAKFFRHLGKHLVFDPISLQLRMVTQ